ncbi:ATPase V1/A1 complex subunit E [Trinorchestia longiramus]|nr:ATPase V1/A1 complex subunit E [Trinorchestia longiramus]
MALSDADVQKQITHMMAFIEQEANEKAEEIEARAEEEFTIEKGRLVQQNRLKINEFYDRKEKNVEMQRKIGASNLLNKSRVEVLQAQEAHVKSVLQEAEQQLSVITKDTSRYSLLLQNLITQGLCQLMEPAVTVKCREADRALVEAAVPLSVEAYTRMSNLPCKVTVDTTNWLPSYICGGVELTVRNNRIKISNTLEARLDMLSQQMLPEVRAMLFGKNANRKFDN